MDKIKLDIRSMDEIHGELKVSLISPHNRILANKSVTDVGGLNMIAYCRGQCCGSGIQDPRWVKNQDPDPR